MFMSNFNGKQVALSDLILKKLIFVIFVYVMLKKKILYNF